MIPVQTTKEEHSTLKMSMLQSKIQSLTVPGLHGVKVEQFM